jgi:hypothetical protein
VSETPVVTLFSSGLLSKWGFSDGDAPDEWLDYCDDNGIDLPPAAWHPILRELVKQFLLPALAQEVTVTYGDTSHNPVRAQTVDGTDVDGRWYGDAEDIELTPECVEIPMSEVEKVARKLYPLGEVVP